jgi:arsenate reductase
MTVTIYHNPRCSKSRQTLALLEERGLRPEIIHYLKEPPSEQELKRIIAALGLAAHALIRSSEAEYAEFGLNERTSDSELIAAMVQAPKLIQRPIVCVTDQGGMQARIGRPPEDVLEILS